MFIQLTTAYDTKIWVNVGHIIRIEGYNKGALLDMRGSKKDLCVQETPDEIVYEILKMNEETVRLAGKPEVRLL